MTDATGARREPTRRAVLKAAGLSAVGLAASSLGAGRTASAAVRETNPTQSTVAFYLSPHGKDSNSGTLRAPFATLERARDAIRALKTSSGLPAGGVSVYLRGGRYERSSTFTLDEQDSGTVDAPITYQAYPGENAEIVGSRVLANSAFGPVTDAAIHSRLSAAVRDKVVQISLPAQGITDYGTIRTNNYAKRVAPATPQLVFNDQLPTLARWPNTGYTAMGAIVTDGLQGTDLSFHYTDGRPDTWATIDDTWLMTYPKATWAFQTQPIVNVDTSTKVIECGEPTQSGALQGARYYYFNVLEELDSPGEWYLDRSTGMLYLYPPADLATASVRLTQLDEPLITMSQVDYLRLANLSVGETRAVGVASSGGSYDEVTGCTFRFIGNRPVEFTGGGHNRVTGCTIADTGTGGVLIDAGDRTTLAPGNCRVEGSRFSRFSNVNPTYSPAIAVAGVGNSVAHNEIFDAPHEGMSFAGNDHVIEYNDLHHLVTDSSDAGAIYGGADWTFRGIVFRYNYFHDIVGDARAGVYLDDMVSGCYIYGNVFDQVSVAVKHCGRHNVVENNLMIGCDIPVMIFGVGTKALPALSQRLAAMPYTTDPWAARYPELLTILSDDPIVPKYNTVIYNAMADCGAASYVQNASEYGFIETNYSTSSTDPGLVTIEDEYRYVAARSPILTWIPGFAQLRAGTAGPSSASAELKRASDLVVAFQGSGDVDNGLAARLTRTLTTVRQVLRRADSAATASLLKGFGSEVSRGVRQGACSAMAADGLGALVNIVLATVTTDAFTDLTAHPTKPAIAVGDTLGVWAMGDTLSGTYVNVLPSYTLTSQTPSVATIGENHTVQGRSTGTATIQAAASYGGLTRTGDVSFPVVSALLQDVAVSADTRLLSAGQTVSLTVTGGLTNGTSTPIEATEVQFESSDTSVATVDANGVVTGVGEGITIITVVALLNGISKQGSIGLMVTDGPPDLPTGWAVDNYGHVIHGGDVATQGAASYRNGTFHVMTNGANIWYNSGDLTFLHQKAGSSTDLTVTATIDSGTGSAAGYGVMIRGGLAADSYEVSLRRQDNGQVNLVYRNADRPNTGYTPIMPAVLPVGLRLEKQGTIFSAYLGADGSWTKVGSVDADLGTDLHAGIGIYASSAGVAEVYCSDLVIE